MNLKDNQKTAIEKFRKLKIGALFMEPGTGKTRTMLEILKDIDTDYILWITPFPSKENLRKEIEKWQFKKDVRIEGIESIQSSDKLYLELYMALKNTKKAIIIVDESFKIKNSHAKRTKRLKELGNLAEYRFVLNGTPVAKNYLDLHSQIEFLSPKVLNMGLVEFKNTFIEYVQVKVKKGNKVIKKYEYIKDYRNLNYLYAVLDPYIFDSKLEINKNKVYDTISFSYKKEIKEWYFEYIDKCEKMAVIYDKYIEMMQKVQHSISIENNKVELIEQIVDEKTIIFCKYISTKEFLKEKFKNALVLTYSSGSASLNLQEYNKIIFFDKTFDYLQREQAEHRIYRMGQEHNCHFYDLTGDLAIDKIIDENISKKISMNEHFKKLLVEKGEKWVEELKKKN